MFLQETDIAHRAVDLSGILQGTIGEVSQSVFNLKGEVLRYTDQEYLLTGLNETGYDTMLFMTSRQIGKSTLLSVRQTLPSLLFPNFETLYVSPSWKQTKEYSQTRVEPLIRESDYVRDVGLIDKHCHRGTETKSFTNGSRMVFRYAFYNADRARGISAQLLLLDEIQDILWDNVPVIEQCLAHAKPPASRPEWAPFYKKKIYSGTPKSLQNTMQYLWEKSTQCVWIVPCVSCGKSNTLTERSIGKYGTICTTSVRVNGHVRQCAKYVDPRHGQWHALKPESRMLSFHISQLMVPRKEWGPHGWIDWPNDILDYRERYDKVRFYNEVLGLPCDNALRALTTSDMMSCCDENWTFRAYPDQVTRMTHLWAGVDWGETNSRTVLTIGGFFEPGIFSVVYMRVYSPQECEPRFLIDDILKWLYTFNVQGIACDVGHGWGLNSTLMEKYGMDRVFPIRYTRSTSPRLTFVGGANNIKWEWNGNRSQLLGELFMDVRRRRIRFPKWSQFGEHVKDWLAVFSEYSGRSKELIYSHNPDDPDDRVHSCNYARIAAELGTGYNTSLSL